MQFFFKNNKGDKRDSCFFAMFDQIIEFNFEKESYLTYYQFKTPLTRQPQFFRMNTEQTIMVAATEQDAIYMDINAKKEVDLDEEYNLTLLKEVIFDEDDKTFYIIANNFNNLFGVFIFNLQ